MGCHPSHWRTPSFFRGVGQPPTRYIWWTCVFFLVDILLDTMLISQAIMCGKKIAHLGNWGSWNSGAWTINSTKKPWGKVGDENTYDWDQLYTVCFSCWGEWDWNGIAHSIHFLSQKMEFCHILNEDIYPISHEKNNFVHVVPQKIVLSHGQFEDLDLGGSPFETKVTLLLSRPQKVQLLGGKSVDFWHRVQPRCTGCNMAMSGSLRPEIEYLPLF